MKKVVLIVAGGRGLRMGGDLPKQFIPIAGKPVLMHTVEAFYRWDATAELILVLPEDHQPYWKMLCTEIGCKAPHRIANGGETRFHSVRNGLRFFAETRKVAVETDEPILVAVHDGVRPFVAPEVISQCFSEAEVSGATVPVIPVVDSLRMLSGDGDSTQPVDRSLFRAVQTPQIFDYALLRNAYEQPYSELFTDDASVVEAFGHSITIVPGNRENIKITTPFDLYVAEALLMKD